MTISHHPLDETLAAFAGGHLDEGRALVVSIHLAACAQCRRTLAMCEQVGGELLERVPETAMAGDALSLALARLDGPEPVLRARPAAPPELREDDFTYPPALVRYGLGTWRPIGRGIALRSVRVPRQGGTRVFLLKAAPGLHVPRHTHTGVELTCVLKGAFSHAFGRYGPGDVDEADDTVEHRPTVEPGEICISLVALQGNVRFSGLIGRLLQPFVRM